MEDMRMVVGFAFDNFMEPSSVLLIRKAAPSWQAGMLNGFGGKCKPEESDLAAMIRECKEETGVPTKVGDWTVFARMSGVDRDGNRWEVTCFKCKAWRVYSGAKTITSEPVIRVLLEDVKTYPRLNNLDMLLAIALDESGLASPVHLRY
jgi:8-oxo-dGTP pyrophosphatase MutT (NUDIX family)